MGRLSAITPDIRRIAALLRPALGLEAVETPPPDLALARFAAKRHRVGPLLHRALADRDDIAPDVRAFLTESYEENVRRHLRHRALTQKFTGWLAGRGHARLVVKGWELGEALYGEAALRYSKDIDLLIGPDAMEDALELAATHGFKISTKQGEAGLRKARRLIGRFKEIGVADPAMRAQIELHSRLLAQPPEGWSDPAPGDTGWPVLTNPHYLLYLMIHGCWTYWDRLKWLADLAMLAQRTAPEVQAEVSERARHFGCEEAMVAGLTVAGDVWGEELVQSWLARTRATPENGLLQAHRTKVIERLTQTGRPSFPRRVLRHSGILRDPPVFGTHPPRIASTIDRAIFWLAWKF